MGVIISGFPGCGMTWLKEEYGKKISIAKLNQEDFTSLEEYVNTIVEKSDTADIVLASTDKQVRKVLNDNEIDFDYFYPGESRRLEFLMNAVRKKNNMEANKKLDSEWVDMIEAVEAENFPHCRKHCLKNPGEYIGNDLMVKNFISNLH